MNMGTLVLDFKWHDIHILQNIILFDHGFASLQKSNLENREILIE